MGEYFSAPWIFHRRKRGIGEKISYFYYYLFNHCDNYNGCYLYLEEKAKNSLEVKFDLMLAAVG
jgi:hypothetical protein